MNPPPRPATASDILDEVRSLRRATDANFGALGVEVTHLKTRVGELESRVHRVERDTRDGVAGARQHASNASLENEAAIAGIAIAFDSLVRAQAKQHNDLIDMHRAHGAYLHQIHTRVVPEVFGQWWRRPEVWRGAAYFVAALVGSLIAQGVFK